MGQVQTGFYPIASRQITDHSALANLEATFIQNVEHELRTPLVIVQGYIDLLSDGTLGELAPEQKQAIFAIANHTDLLRVLVDRIGVLLEAQAGAHVSLALRLDELARKVVESRHKTALNAGLTLDLHSEPGMQSVAGDPRQLWQMLDCLLENSIKFTPPGGQIQVHLYTQTGWGNLVVSDTGIGISERHQINLFSGFYQVDNTSSRCVPGIGLGLTLVKTVVEAHGGSVEVKSQAGHGSQFTVKLPIAASMG